jgi:tRNA(Ile)-lysidine synthase
VPTLLDRAAAAVACHRMFEEGQAVGVAVSGGADSVCLLHVLKELGDTGWGLRLAVLHVNHKLRGAESEADAEFVRDLAASLGLPLLMRDCPVAAGDGNLEQAAREARLAFFREVLNSGAVARVATGHTRSDQAETVLFRFLRGAGTAGLAGIRPVTTEGLVRPLLDIDRSEVLEFLGGRGIGWREDSSNASFRFARNRIRHHLLPLLQREWNPAVVEALAATAEWARDEEEYWRGVIGRLAAAHLVERQGAFLLPVEALRELPQAAARRLVRHAMERVRGDLRGVEREHVEMVLAMAAAGEGHGRMQAPGLDIFRSFEWLRFGPREPGGLPSREYEIAVEVPGTYVIPGSDLSLSFEVLDKSRLSADSRYNDKVGVLDWRAVSGPIQLRNWRPGDQYTPLGSAAEKRVKTLFQEARVPIWERRRWPVLTGGNSILWVRRFGPAAQAAAAPGAGEVLAIWERPGENGIGFGRNGV